MGSEVSSVDLRDMDKRSARAVVRQVREGLAQPDHEGTCAELGRFLDRQVPGDRVVVVYDAMGDEVDLRSLIDAHPEPTARFALTRTPDEGHRLTVHAWGGPTEQHRYGYSQPAAGEGVVDDDRIGAVLVPALVFDGKGARLGRGKGYYDRFLARLGSHPLRIGMTAGLLADEVPTDSFDVAMTHLCLPDGVVTVPVADQR